ncbi:MAG: hypothetical protein AAFZ63_14365 [Bacteroidota bacterium]
MNKIIALYILCSLLSSRMLVGQVQSINCIIFFNGKLPYKSEIEGDIVVKDSLNEENKINFSYQIGEMYLSVDDKETLFSLSFETELQLTVFHINDKNKKLPYTTSIRAGWLRWSFIIFRITTLRRGRYHFGISGPSFSSEFIKQEYDIFD